MSSATVELPDAEAMDSIEKEKKLNRRDVYTQQDWNRSLNQLEESEIIDKKIEKFSFSDTMLRIAESGVKEEEEHWEIFSTVLNQEILYIICIYI